MSRQLSLARNEWCLVCNRTTTWRLDERPTGPMYVCSGGSKTLNHTNTGGCGRAVPANEFHVRHNSTGQP